MKVVVQLVPDDYRWFRRYVIFHIHGLGRIFLIGYIVISVLHQLNEPATSSTGYRIADQIALTAILVILWFIMPKLTDWLSRGFKRPLGEHVFEIRDGCFRESNEFGDRRVMPEGIRDVRETDSHFLILFQDATAAIMPKRSINDCSAVRAAFDELGVRWNGRQSD